MIQQRPLGLGTHIFVPNADAAVEFYRAAFGASELIRHNLPDGRILFVELAFGPDKLLLSQEISELNALAPASVGGGEPWRRRAFHAATGASVRGRAAPRAGARDRRAPASSAARGPE